MNNLRFRAATETDVPAIVYLANSAYRGDASRGGWTSEADLLEGQRVDSELLRDDIARGKSIVLVAEHGADGAPALDGCAQVSLTATGTAYFGLFAVRPTGQGSGLGKRLLAEAERLAAHEWGATVLEMTVIEQRPELIAFYERRGYSRTGEYRDFPYGDERFGIPLREDLRLVVLSKPLAA